MIKAETPVAADGYQPPKTPSRFTATDFDAGPDLLPPPTLDYLSPVGSKVINRTAQIEIGRMIAGMIGLAGGLLLFCAFGALVGMIVNWLMQGGGMDYPDYIQTTVILFTLGGTSVAGWWWWDSSAPGSLTHERV